MDKIDKIGLIQVREYTEADHNFVIATFLRGIYHGDSWFSQIPKHIFMEKYHPMAERLIELAHIRVACLEEDPDVILGYSIFRKSQSSSTGVLDYIFVKSAWRKIGIAKKLIPSNVEYCTHLTKLGLALLREKLPKVVFNPFL